MTISMCFSRTAMLTLGISCLGAGASAQYDARTAPSLQAVYADSIGAGAGSIHLPTSDGEGLMVGILVDDKDGRRYTLEAVLTAWIPGLFGPQTRVAMGGLYGDLAEVSGHGMLQGAEPQRVGRVEGTWRMERNFTGSYVAYVYERTDGGLEVLAGMIEGGFRVHESEAAVPAPQSPDFVAHRRSKGLSDALGDRPGLDDAASAAKRVRKERAGSDLVDVRRGFSAAGPATVKKQRPLRDAAGSPVLEPGDLSTLALTQPLDFGDARSSAPVLSDARPAGKASGGGSDDLRDAASGKAGGKTAFGDAASSDPASVKDAWDSAARSPFATPTKRGQELSWPTLGGVFHARFVLMSIG